MDINSCRAIRRALDASTEVVVRKAGGMGYPEFFAKSKDGVLRVSDLRDAGALFSFATVKAKDLCILGEHAAGLFADGRLGLPFPECRFAFVMYFEDKPRPMLPMLLCVKTEATGRFQVLLSCLQKRTGADAPVFIAIFNAVFHIRENGEHTYEYVGTVDDAVQIYQELALNGMLGLSMVLADSRISVTRMGEPRNSGKKTKERSGFWQVDTSRVQELYATILQPADRRPRQEVKGTHASPVPHDRRGHIRHLRNGKQVWVEATRVGELTKHMTRKRSFYDGSKLLPAI